ncbi:hypothetical protein [Streptomyces sp. NPDC007369]|uniref:hypothetical protein n=1 Tax=Streptomyces sp. NPDC007369 TaxID=3154589 RepID=UPI0034103ED6
MEDIRQASITCTGLVTADEYDEGVTASGVFRRLRWIVAAAVAVLAALSVTATAEGGSVNLVLLGLAVAYGALGWILPPWLYARAFRADQAKGEKRMVLDAAGILVTRGDEEIMRVPWTCVSGHRETPRLYVLTGKAGRKSFVGVLPKRLLTGPGEAELVGALLEAHDVRRGRLVL